VLGVHRDGGFCEWLCFPERNVVPVDGLGLDEAAMVEFLAIGAHGVRRSKLTADDRVLVVGAGPIGLAAAIFAKVRGAAVSMLDINAQRLAFASDAVGVDATFEASADLEVRLATATGGDFFDVVIDATGSPASMQKGFGYVGHGGTYVFLSLVRADLTFNDPEFHKRETTLLGSRNATPADFQAVMAAMREGRIPTAALATHRLALAEVPERFPALLDPAERVVKALVDLP
jgi:2-desacetyl-2-hydroxyethyl bacteriochlorophyllide A dehydrogenase